MFPNLTVLLAEDDPNDQLLFKIAFSKTSSRPVIHFVDNGDAVIRYLSCDPPFEDRIAHPFPDLLLLDVRMPRRDGFDVLEWLRRNDHARPSHVSMFTALNRCEDMEKALRLGADSYFVKPPSLSELVSMLKDLQEFQPRKLAPRYGEPEVAAGAGRFV